MHSIIQGLEKDKENLERTKATLQKEVSIAIKDSNKEISEKIRYLTIKSQEAIEDQFKNNKKSKKEQQKPWANELRILKEMGIKKPLKFFRSISRFLKKRKSFDNELKRLFNNNTSYSTDEKHRADDLIEKIKQTLNEFTKELYESSFELLKDDIIRLEDNLNNKTTDLLKDTLSKASERLGEEVFFINFKIPKPLESSTFNLDMDSFVDSILEEKTETYKSYHFRGGWWGEFVNFLNSSWGYEEYKNEKTIYRIDIEKVKKNMVNHFNLFGDKVKEGHENYLNTTMKPNIEDRVQELENYLERYRGDLSQGVKDQENHAQYKSQFIDALNLFIDRIQPLEQDTQDIANELRKQKPQK